ncbi:hypothetical protein AFM16_00940 [Streptomyces antibioticus]|uniref:Uncharacterized protein n=1 Tax=Streptomyces antibioticus TaxID=1890 RepID=A0ABX3LRC5_STRAT|nr:hypothetical protein AFM16_00940 [Streptomyces antibioticus]
MQRAAQEIDGELARDVGFAQLVGVLLALVAQTSASSVMTRVVGSPLSWSRVDRKGEAQCSARWAGSVVQASQNHFMASRVR